MKIALDATYSVGSHLSGVGVYSHEILHALWALRPQVDWHWLYRPHRIGRALREHVPDRVRRGLLLDWRLPGEANLFHGLNQRLHRRRFKRTVVTFHDLFVMTAEYSTPEFRARFTGQAAHAASQADHIIAVSQFTADQVTALLGIESSRITAVPHGVRPFEPVPGVVREPLVLHVGAIQKRKNLVRLVQAFRALPPPWELVLAGSSGFGAESVLSEIARSPVRNRIRLTGYLSAAKLADLYSRASIFAFPSLDEGFGMPVLEAMSAGVPVLASSTSAVGEIAGSAALKINPLETDQIAYGLNRLAADEMLRANLRNQGRLHSATFTWERSARETFEVYRNVLNA